MPKHMLQGNFPILATAWTDDGRFDPTSQARLIDWLIDSGVHGLVMAANASEGHAQSDAEKDQILEFGMKRIAGRVPVIITVTHFAVEIAVEKARRAEEMGAACVMSMPQFFGNWGSDLAATFTNRDRTGQAISMRRMRSEGHSGKMGTAGNVTTIPGDGCRWPTLTFTSKRSRTARQRRARWRGNSPT